MFLSGAVGQNLKEKNHLWFGQMAGWKSPLGAWGITCERAFTIQNYKPRLMIGYGIREGSVIMLGTRFPILKENQKIQISGNYLVSFFSRGELEYEVSNDLENYEISSSIAQTPSIQFNYQPFQFKLSFIAGFGYRFYHKSPEIISKNNFDSKLKYLKNTIDAGYSLFFGISFAF